MTLHGCEGSAGGVGTSSGRVLCGTRPRAVERVHRQSRSQSVSQLWTHPALTPPSTRNPAPPLSIRHKYRVPALGGYSIACFTARDLRPG